ncbi:MAG: MOSC N-terminal beta barrel domain-containing protein [Bacteroidota bacterium]
MKVISLGIYPVKGAKGISVPTLNALERGFEHDRRYMLIGEDGTFISQRTDPELVHVLPQIRGDQIHLHYKGHNFTIPLSEATGNTVEATIFDKPVSAVEVSENANRWFSSVLAKEVRLVKMREEDVRHKELIKGPEKVEVSFADGYPYLIVGTASLDKLNSQMDRPLRMDRFRPNIVIRTSEPHIEDTWERIKIGSVEFMIIKQCARCQVVTIDQATGLSTAEPLKTLSTYRKEDNKVYFGANAISRQEGLVHVGDEVEVL